jgi:hypothetical protein
LAYPEKIKASKKICRLISKKLMLDFIFRREASDGQAGIIGKIKLGNTLK